MKTYLAITIGPIYKTFSEAKRTRAIWAASYFFSYFMREILTHAINNHWEIILPYSKEIKKATYGAGLYADRLYFENKTKAEIEPVIEILLKNIAEDFKKQNICEEGKALTFLKNYLNLHIVEITLNEIEINVIKNSKNAEGKSDKSILKLLNNLLDNKELQFNYNFNYNENYLIDYFSLPFNTDTLLKTDAFPEATKNYRHFKSIGEIATADLADSNTTEYIELLNADFRNEDLQLIDLLKKDKTFNNSFNDYHKYYAVLYADGDNIGELLSSVANDSTELQKFSELLLNFGLETEKTIADFGGAAIYLGGEDILAFLPIAYTDSSKKINTLAKIIKEIDDNFQKTIGNYADEKSVTIPTLSYGIMLAYYKHPMRETMQQAHQILENCKKNFGKTKNVVGVRFQKHSGQYTECYIEKNKSISSQLIYKLLTEHVQVSDKKKILSGLIQRLKDPIFFTTFMHAVRNKRTDAFFANFFNEDIHTTKSEFIDYFKAIATALGEEYLSNSKETEAINKENEKFKNILFTILRYYQFIQPKQK